MSVLVVNSNFSEETLNETAQSVLRKFGITPEGISLIQGDSIKTVWRIKTAGENLCLKRLKQSYDKALFSVNAQIHIKNAGGKVPGIIPAKDGRLIIDHNEQLFVLYDWIEGSDLDFSSPSDMHTAIRGLAAFHAASKGYVPVESCRVSSKLGKWPDQYRSMLNKLKNWKETAASDAFKPDYAAYLKYADRMTSIGELALEALKTSGYSLLTGSGSAAAVLCHQDYGRGNVLNSKNGVFILDLDGVTFDLPARDLRKLTGKNAENRNQWEASAIMNILKWYEEGNPLSNEDKNVLYIDLLFPHWFFGLVKNLFQNGKSLKAVEIERIAKLEESKVQIIKVLLKRSEQLEHRHDMH